MIRQANMKIALDARLTGGYYHLSVRPYFPRTVWIRTERARVIRPLAIHEGTVTPRMGNASSRVSGTRFPLGVPTHKEGYLCSKPSRSAQGVGAAIDVPQPKDRIAG